MAAPSFVLFVRVANDQRNLPRVSQLSWLPFQVLVMSIPAPLAILAVGVNGLSWSHVEGPVPAFSICLDGDRRQGHMVHHGVDIRKLGAGEHARCLGLLERTTDGRTPSRPLPG